MDKQSARIHAMDPESRADLATFMRQQRDAILEKITKLQAEAQDLTAWLEEFDR